MKMKRLLSLLPFLLSLSCSIVELEPLPTLAPTPAPLPTKTLLRLPTSSPTSTVTPTFTPLPTFTLVPTRTSTSPTRIVPLAFKFDNGVSASLQKDIQAGGDMAEKYYHLISGDPSAKVTLYAYNDFTALVKAETDVYRALGFTTDEEEERKGWGDTVCGHGTVAAVFLRISNTPCWTGVLRSSTQALVTHEYFHAQQGNMAGRRFSTLDTKSNTSFAGPAWLIEGSAEYFAFRSVANAKVIKFSAQRIQFVTAANGVSLPLDKLESSSAFADQADAGSYSLAALAAEYLLWGRGEVALLKYYRAIGEGITWKTAFNNSFAKSPEDFYKSFETYRKANYVLAPSGKVKGKITLAPTLQPIYVWLCSTKGAWCEPSRAEADGSYEVTLPPDTYTLWVGQDEDINRSWGGYVDDKTLSTDKTKLRQIEVDGKASVMVNVTVAK